MNKIQTPFLALETSGINCSVSLFLNSENIVELNYIKKNIHSEILFDAIFKILSIAGLSKNELNAIAISSGPGSFTGLRIGYAAAKGLATGLNIPIIPVNTFDAIAFEISSVIGNNKEFHIVRKVNNSEHYVASYRKNGEIIEIINEITLMKTEEIIKLSKRNLIYSETKLPDTLTLPEIRSSSVAKWAYLFGENLLTYKFEFIEPIYFKNFIPKVKK